MLIESHRDELEAELVKYRQWQAEYISHGNEPAAAVLTPIIAGMELAYELSALSLSA